ncbi:hypothetical protein D3C87_449590 [compost metagenome]
MDDVLGGVARPGHVGFTGGQGLAHRVQAGHEVAVGAQHVVNLLAHARHDAHVDGHVGAVGEFNADVRDVRTQRTHRERHHIQRAAAHRAVEQAAERVAHFGGVGPVVGGAGVFGAVGADEGAVFHPRHVGRIRAREERIRTLGGVQPAHGSRLDHLFAKAVVFFLRPIAPHDAVRLGQRDEAGDPVDQSAMLDVRGHVQGCQSPVQRLIHWGYLHTKANGDTAPIGLGPYAICAIILAAPGNPSTHPHGGDCHRVRPLKHNFRRAAPCG